MPRVVALYRYPVKGFAPEECRALTVLDQGRIAGDRSLAFRFADSAIPDDAWGRKQECIVLMNTPGLARLQMRLDHNTLRLAIALDGAQLVEAALDADGRQRLATTLANYVLTLAESPLNAHPERLPLRLVGDGITPRYQDNEGGQCTLHGRGSLAAVSVAVNAAAGERDLDEARFRSNISVGGLEAWEEQEWLGRRVRVGDVEFEVERCKVRCLATHANPRTGERDLAIMQTLMKAFGQQQPTFAIGMVTRGHGGIIRVGDIVHPVD